MTASDLAVVDSSGWLEYLTGGPKADQFEPYLANPLSLLVPSIVIYEVRKVLLAKRPRIEADLFLSQALRGSPVAFDERLAIAAAEISIEKKLAMADAIIYTTALRFEAHLYTGDHHFSGLDGVTVF